MSCKRWLHFVAAVITSFTTMSLSAANPRPGSLVTEFIDSTILRENRTGLAPRRRVKVYLPPSYADSGRRYPVVYFCHNINWSAEQVFQDGNMARSLERAFASGVIKEFILVAADYSSPTMGSLYENSPISGRWLDFTVQELVPFIDGKFRTRTHRDSRALAGDFMGGRGALKLAMSHSDLFSVAYALHPVATGSGSLPYNYIPVDWRKIHAAKTFAELAGPGREQIFLVISQAFLPNASRPPFYCDFFTEMENGQPKLSPENTRKLQKAFHLDEHIEEFAANLRTMRGLALDWARHDSTQAHVEAAREFTRKLQDAGVEHEAEEYLGNPWDKNWTEHGRFNTRLLPFFARHLVFED
jgi:S-formylglutathione hydrolase FrmB